MVTPQVGAVVLVPFPFSDLSRTKLRPAVVLADAGRDDWILCQLTSNPYGDQKAVAIPNEAFLEGTLDRQSFARPGKLFTASNSLVLKQAGLLKAETLSKIIEGVVRLLHGSGA